MSDRYEQGAAVVASDPFGGGDTRPYLVMSNDTHPFGDAEVVPVVVTTTERDRAIPLATTYLEGAPPYESFVSLWSPVTLKHGLIDKRVAHVSNEVVSDAADALYGYVTPTEDT